MNQNFSVKELSKGHGQQVVDLWKNVLPPDEVCFDSLPAQLDFLFANDLVRGSAVFIDDNRCAAFGLSCFVDDDVVDEFLVKPEPYFNLRLLGRQKNGEELMLGVEAQAKGNSGDGLSMVVLDYVQETFDFSDPWAQHLLNVIVPTYHSNHAGFNIKRSLHETDDAVGHIQIAGGNLRIKPVSPQHPFSLSRDGYGPRSVYGVARGEESIPATGIARVLLYHSPPALRLVPREQEIVRLAISGLTDTAIAEQLGISRDGVRQRWSGIFDHIEDLMPDFYDSGETSGVTTKRGAEKRRSTLAFLAAHPSELRPHTLRR